MSTRRASVRRQVRIGRPAQVVWDLVGDPGRIQEWFPGIVSSTVEGATRTVVTASGLPMPEEILTCDDLARRFQYRITAPLFVEHLSTLDVLDLGDGTCLAVYAADAEPAVLALVIAGAAGNALRNVRRLMETA